MKINYKKVLFLLVVYFIYTYIFKGYISYTPTIPVYPNSKKEIEKVKQKINERTQLNYKVDIIIARKSS